MDTENKLAWCESGAKSEEEFVKSMRFNGLGFAMNADKAFDPYTNDLTIKCRSDLKSVRTPLFKAKGLYGLDPQYAITFNVKDGKRYKELYPNILVVFDVKWEQLEWTDREGFVYTVEPMHQVYMGSLTSIRQAIIKAGKKLHAYQRRVDDRQGNAKDSYVFDVRELHRIK
jgi:hypothetical protein